MSVDEIRNIALGKVPMHYKQAADGFVVLDDIVVRNALLAYAAMVERTNERRGTFAANYGRIDYEHDSAIVDEIDYILRGDVGKGEGNNEK